MAHIKTFKNISLQTLDQLSDSGCQELFIGVESGSDKILKMIHKTKDIEQIKVVINKLSKSGIAIKAYFIYGFPGETDIDSQMTYNLAQDLKNICQQNGAEFRTSVFKFRPYDGTELGDMLMDQADHQVSIGHDVDLNSKIKHRAQFNFMSENYSDYDNELLDDNIAKTLALNEV